MALKNKTQQCADQYHQLEAFSERPSLWQNEIRDLLDTYNQEFENWDQHLESLQKAARLITIFKAGLENNALLKTDIANTHAPLWGTFYNPPVDTSLQDSVATKLHVQKKKPDDMVIITIDEGARYIGLKLIELSEKDDIPFRLNITDENFNRLIFKHISVENALIIADQAVDRLDGITKKIFAGSGTPNYDLVPRSEDTYKAYLERYSQKAPPTGTLDYCLTSIPTQKDAEIDGIPYPDYIRLYFEMCDQPWDHMNKAQQKLIDILNVSTQLHFTNTDGTDLTMDLIDENGKHMTFCNSLVARNVPGSEVFSAPRRDSVNGKIVSKGRFAETPGEIIENLTMEFNKGKLTSYHADKGVQYFEEYINRTPNTRYIGEIGIGTNPHLKTHIMNTLLVEKIGGSFHVALGGCYQMKEYCGVPVHVNNGNLDTGNHWDITTMLYGKGGTIEADGNIIMQDGKFVDPDLAVLNDGWAAVPVKDRPAYWKTFKGYKDGIPQWGSGCGCKCTCGKSAPKPK